MVFLTQNYMLYHIIIHDSYTKHTFNVYKFKHNLIDKYKLNIKLKMASNIKFCTPANCYW